MNKKKAVKFLEKMGIILVPLLYFTTILSLAIMVDDVEPELEGTDGQNGLSKMHLRIHCQA